MKNYWQFLTNVRSFSAFIYDVLVAFVAWGLSFMLRFNFDIPSNFKAHLIDTILWVVIIQASIFIIFGLYQGIWRFASIPDLKRIIKAVMVAAITVAALLFMSSPLIQVPRSVLILDPILLVLLMGGSRFTYRAWKENHLYGASQLSGQPVILIGAGDLAVSLLKDLARSKQWRVVGLLDEDKAVHGRLLIGSRVLGSIAMLPEVISKFKVKHIIIALPSDSYQLRRQAIELASRLGVTSLTLPIVDDLMSGKVSVSQIRKVDVEDLLGREPVTLDNLGLHALIEGHAVLVSGAGGSIGSELCRQIVKYNPKTLVCLDISEFALYNLEQELSQANTAIQLIYITGDVKNSQRIKSLLNNYQPAIVFHAAAYKHVPMMENGNVWEALSNNVIGTYTLAQACKDAQIAKFVLISTDKAVNPTNVMGASKRLAEMVCQGMQESVNNAVTKFVIVRFGNVLGSSGSVIPKFREQIAKGGPVTITHPEITRYFMSIPEAAQLVMQAGLMGAGGDIFVLDMGEPVKIAALAADMIRLSGLQTDEIKIEYVGLRPGEKLYEELLADDEHTLPTPHEKLRIAVARGVNKAWVKKLLKWIDSVQETNETDIKNELKLWVEEYIPHHHSKAENTAATIAPVTFH
ncbi:MAG: polysaccharide biosynthesis protein [Methylotenera sp.]|nr:polysaccharide biosynthesis protein [Methylotenera sp.]